MSGIPPDSSRGGSALRPESSVDSRWTGADLVAVAAAFGLPLALYLRTMAPTVYGLDSGELTAGAYGLGIVHAPGAPTYLLLAHVFTWLPIGDIGYRVNLFSAFSAALAAAFVFAVLRRLAPGRWQALAGTLYVATTYYFWVTALAAELYALHVALLGMLLWLGQRWQERRQPEVLLWLCLLYGLGLGNHLALAVMAPGFLLLVTGGMPEIWKQPRLLLAGAAAMLGGCAVYLYLPIRAAAGVTMNYARDFGVDVTTWSGFWWMVSGSMFGAQMFGVPLAGLPAELTIYAHRLWSNFLGLGFLLGGVGMFAGLRRYPQFHAPLFVMFMGHVLFVASYDVADKDQMLLPSFVIWGLWAAMGAQAAIAYAVRRLGNTLSLSATALLLAMATANVALNHGRVDISNDWSARIRGELLLNWLPADTLYVGTWADAALIDYLQLVEGMRPDVRLANVFLVRGSRRRGLVDEHLGRGLPVFASEPVHLGKKLVFEFNETCGCYRVRFEPRPACFAAPPSRRQCRPPESAEAPP
jgi:hypothetical protein